MCRLLRFCLAVLLTAVMPLAPACAQSGTDLFSAETLHASGDLRVVGVDGEPGWLDGGYGKARFGDHGDFRVRPEAVEGDLIWQPRFTWALTGTVVAIAQQGQDHPIDLSEGFLSWKPMMAGTTKVSARAGLFWPPVSLEHGHADWRVEETITPSAINSWIGEEVKVGGLEATVTRPLAGGRVALTAAAFGLNSTAGTLLAFRGWALHDEKATAFGYQPLPPLDAFWVPRQAARTKPVLQVDGRVGWYAKLAWSPAQALQLEYLHYDNRGNPDLLLPSLQWGWRTRFDDVGAVVIVGPVTLKAQGVRGRGQMGYQLLPGRTAVDTVFRSAYLLATVPAGRRRVSARVEAFGTRTATGSSVPFSGVNAEDGWAATGAIKREIGPYATVLAEAIHIDSRRDARVGIGLAPRQRQTQVQLALRLHV